MEILYIVTLILLGISFMLSKKKDEKINFIKWLIIFIVTLFGYNIFVGMLLGLLNITSHIWLLSLINVLVAILIGFKSIKNKDFQKYFIRKLDIVAILIVFAIFIVMFFKDLYIYKGDISHMAVDSAVHYRAAKHYSDYLKIFINVEDKSFFNFNVMQPGAYINDGIFMNIIHNTIKIDYPHIYQIFETMVLFLTGLAFYASFADKIKTKRGLLGSMVAFALFIYGYPYNSWFYGFSYLSVGLMFICMLISVVETLYENFDRKIIIPLVILLSTGLIFSYSLFVPAVFASICIYCFLKDLSRKEEKKYLKLFGKTTLIVTALLVVVTIAGIGYLVIPTFVIEDQTDLVSALKIDGAIYSERYRNFLVYIPFAIIYAVEIIKKIKNKELTYMDIFALIMVGFFAVVNIGLRLGKVSLYYTYKVYYAVWIAILAVTIDLINKYVNEKNIRIDVVILFGLFVIFYLAKISAQDIFKIYLVLFLVFFEVLPELIKKIDFKKFKKINIKPICITGTTYICLWGLFVCGWVWLRAGHILSEEEKGKLVNFVGIYFDENCMARKQVDLTQNFNKNQVELTRYARENLKEMAVENTCLMTKGYYPRMWATATTELNSPICGYEAVTQDTHIYNMDDALNNIYNRYIIKLVSNDMYDQLEYREFRKEVSKMENIKILIENENGFVAEIIRK